MSQSEADKFDAVVRKMLSVSHEEIKKRDAEWRCKRAEKQLAKTNKIKGSEK